MNYIGITVGPILDTMKKTSSPAGVWFSSYFFSTITRDLCLELQDKGYDVFTLPEGYIIKEHLNDYPGIGRYHDRIYACKDVSICDIERDFQLSKENVLHLRAKELEECKCDSRNEQDIYNELFAYIRIHYVILQEKDMDAKGLIKTLADNLDCLELSKNVVGNIGKQYIHQVMYGNIEQGSNPYLKKYRPLIKAASNRYFLLAELTEKGVSVFNIEYLSTLGKMDIDSLDTQKINRYYAIVQCDGDNMGTLLTDGIGFSDLTKQKKRQQKITEYCIRFAESAIKDISEYGGFAIYAGGDDLLFFAPIIGKTGESLWEFCNGISRKFTEIFRGLKEDGADYTLASLSIGVSINYYKYPLYEALADVQGLLFETAKKYSSKREKPRIKNNIAIKLRKASGSECGFVCWMDSANSDNNGRFDELISILKKYYLTGDKETVKEKNLVMHSVLYHMESMKKLFSVALGSGKWSLANNLFHNYFDNANQAFGEEMINEISSFATKVADGFRQNLVKGIDFSDGQNPEDELFTVTSIFRTAKFLLEERG